VSELSSSKERKISPARINKTVKEFFLKFVKCIIPPYDCFKIIGKIKAVSGLLKAAKVQ
jgi:hypothetical protein